MVYYLLTFHQYQGHGRTGNLSGDVCPPKLRGRGGRALIRKEEICTFEDIGKIHTSDRKIHDLSIRHIFIS